MRLMQPKYAMLFISKLKMLFSLQRCLMWLTWIEAVAGKLSQITTTLNAFKNNTPNDGLVIICLSERVLNVTLHSPFKVLKAFASSCARFSFLPQDFVARKMFCWMSQASTAASSTIVIFLKLDSSKFLATSVAKRSLPKMHADDFSMEFWPVHSHNLLIRGWKSYRSCLLKRSAIGRWFLRDASGE